MKHKSSDLTRSEKILVFLYEFGDEGRAKVRYEDIVVGLFKKYPADFQLKGYAEYPDSGDLVHKPLYNFKKKGYVNAANKIFSLTDRGVEYVKRLMGKSIAPSGSTKSRLSRSAATEVDRIKNLEGFTLFAKGDSNKLSDNDFYNYLGVTVRTQKNSFIGRLESMNAMIDELKRDDANELYASVIRYHNFLLARHKDIIDFFARN